jgi:hypothetical protein
MPHYETHGMFSAQLGQLLVHNRHIVHKTRRKVFFRSCRYESVVAKRRDHQGENGGEVKAAPPSALACESRPRTSRLVYEQYHLQNNNTSKCLPLRHYQIQRSQSILQTSQNNYQDLRLAADHRQSGKLLTHHQTRQHFQNHQNSATMPSSHPHGESCPNAIIRLSSSRKHTTLSSALFSPWPIPFAEEL